MTSKMKKQAISGLSGSQTTEQLLHELQVHQIELEMQNEELRRTQVELEASQSYYFDLFDLAPVGYVILSEKGLILEANLSAATQLGVARNALVNQSLTPFILPEDQDIYDHHRKQLFETGAPQGCELRILRPNAQPFWARLEATVAQDADGAPVTRAMLSDITERKQAEQTISSLARFPSENPNPVLRITADGKLLYANEAAFILHADWKLEVSKPAPEVLEAPTREVFEKHTTKTVEIPCGERTFSIVIAATPEDEYINLYSRDITEQKLTEKAITDSEKRYRSLFENMFNGFAYCQMLFKDGQPDDFIYLAINSAFEKLTGLKDVVGKKVSQVIPGIRESDPGLFEIYGRVALTGKTETIEIYLEALKMWLTISVYSPQKEYFVAVFDVITRRKQEEEALRESEDKFKYIFDNSVVGKSITQPGGEVHVNKAFCEMLGYSPEEFQNKSWQDITHPDDIELTQREMNVLLSGEKEAVRFTKRYLHKNGSIVWTDVNSSLRRDNQGQSLYFMTTMVDITERRRAEDTLRESHHLLEKTLASLLDAVFIIDSDTTEIMDCNPAASAIFGYSRQEMLGRTTAFLHVDQAALEEFRQHLDRDMEEKGFLFMPEFRMKRKDGTVFPTEHSVIPLENEQGKRIGWVSVVRDIAERKQAEILQDAIYRIAQSADQVESLDALYSAIHTIIQEIMVADNFYIALYDEKNDLLSFPFSVGHRDSQFPSRKPGKGLTEFVLHAGKSVLCDEALYESLIQRGEIELMGVHSPIWLGVPLIVEGRVVGVMVVQDYKNARAYGKHEQRILEFVSSQVAMVIHRKQAEEALRDSEHKVSEALEFNRKILNTSSIGILTYKESGQCVSANAAAAKATGGTMAQLLAQNFHEIPSWKKSGMYQAAIRALDTGIEQLMVVHVVTTFGKDAWVSFSFSSFDSADERHLLVFASDVTERKRAEEALQESENRFHTLFEQAAVGVALVDTKTGRFEEINQSYCDFLGYNREDMLNMFFQDFTYPDDIQENIENNALLLAGEITEFAIEKRYVQKDGSIVWGVLTASPLWVPGEEVSDYVHIAVVQDISERKRLEESLRHSQQETVHANHLLLALSQAAQVVQRTRTKEEVYTAIQEQMTQLGFRSIIFELTHEGIVLRIANLNLASNLVSQAEKMIGLSMRDTRIRLRQGGVFQRVLAQGETIHVKDAAQAVADALPKKMGALARPVTNLFQLEPSTFAALMAGDERIGILAVTGRDLTEADNPAITAFTRQAAIAIQNAQLYEQAQQEIAERKRAEEALEQSHIQLRALTAYWQKAIEAERAHIAREIHDEFGQSMTALKMDLTWLTNRLPEGDERVERIGGMNALVDDSIAIIRRIATELRPNLLDDLGLNAALDWQAREFSRHSGITCKVNLPKDDLALDPALSTALFRIFQEALTNVARYAQATLVSVNLELKDQTVILNTSDNGRGITENEINDPRSLGLLGLRERAAQWGGQATIHGVAGKGTIVTVRIPLPAPTVNGDRR